MNPVEASFSYECLDRKKVKARNMLDGVDYQASPPKPDIGNTSKMSI